MKSKVELELTRSNTFMAQAVSEIKKRPVADLLSSCLEGSTNPTAAPTKVSR